jgi:hypothetical protein
LAKIKLLDCERNKDIAKAVIMASQES